MTDKRDTRCCFTGHRPEKLARGEQYITAALRREIAQAVEDGFTVFISGMARGVDIWAAKEVLRLRDAGADVKLVCAVAFEGMEKQWSSDWQARYWDILDRSDLNVLICRAPSRESYLERDRWMVDHSSRVIAAFDGTPGGTKYTVDYAKKNGVEVRFI